VACQQVARATLTWRECEHRLADSDWHFSGLISADWRRERIEGRRQRPLG
jgi:hypothetical protein